MSHTVAIRNVLRALAVAIAVAAVIDPAIVSHRAARPVISVLSANGARDSLLAARIERVLGEDFTVLPASFAAASATVLVGDALPRMTADIAGPVFAVTGEQRPGASVSIVAVRAPSSTPLDARVPVAVWVHAMGARGRTVELSLTSGGLTFDRATRRITASDERIAAALSYVPTTAGAVPLSVSARIVDAPDSARADLLVDVRDARWPVLFFDPRPSWMSTFVRRAIERDRRFVVTSRVVTSRNVSTDAGQPPSRLDDLAGLSRFATVVVGAPDGLTARDVGGLEAFLRRRGGHVVFLLDTPGAGAYERLTGVTRWLARAENPSIAVVPVNGDSIALRASEIAWPTVLPAGAQPLGFAGGVASDRPVIWRAAVGGGALVVSGALDAWRYRDPSSSPFERYWQTLIAAEASNAPAAVSVQLANAVLAPGERMDVTVTVRDVVLREAAAQTDPSTAAAVLDVDGRPNIPLWPGSEPGTFRGSFRAPTLPGTYRIAASAGGASGDAPLVVVSGARHVSPDEDDLLHAWVSSRGGRIVPAADIAELPRLLSRSLRPSSLSEIRHPMRSGLWIVPFALLLSGEWWLRRRRLGPDGTMER